MSVHRMCFITKLGPRQDHANLDIAIRKVIARWTHWSGKQLTDAVESAKTDVVPQYDPSGTLTGYFCTTEVEV
jgi:hypothetical protein